ncbi:DUF983 domain-containing protein [Flavihumibacter petaseus]|uniref:DUF983 domain-containing protein n=1 Tax=Flavihumibacter petaseus NBRC 106054 TaxID=1220578 RepID=A0A0E9MW36_9BACT|nr:DUF983 domain-containing protein [Flavihumibacter petaseus]GAO41636.1 hypothetical protein FPE01S_01_06500 [Flavihumibacter petaseus NBRC 106054]
MAEAKHERSYLSATIGNYCPRCREGKIFESSNPYQFGKILTMNKECPVCGQPTELEPGFFYGTAYVSYALTVAFSVATFIAWWVLIGFSLKDGDHRVLYWGIFNAIAMIALQPIFMRVSRSVWLSWFVKYEPDWRNKPISKESLERIVPEQMNNW